MQRSQNPPLTNKEFSRVDNSISEKQMILFPQKLAEFYEIIDKYEDVEQIPLRSHTYSSPKERRWYHSMLFWTIRAIAYYVQRDSPILYQQYKCDREEYWNVEFCSYAMDALDEWMKQFFIFHKENPNKLHPFDSDAGIRNLLMFRAKYAAFAWIRDHSVAHLSQNEGRR